MESLLIYVAWIDRTPKISVINLLNIAISAVYPHEQYHVNHAGVDKL